MSKRKKAAVKRPSKKTKNKDATHDLLAASFAVPKEPPAPFRFMQVVKFNWADLDQRYHSHFPPAFGTPQNPKHLIWLGEFPQATGHCVVATYSKGLPDFKPSEIHTMYHSDNFVAVPEEDI